VAKASLPAAKRESSLAARGTAPRGKEELRAAVMVANSQSLGGCCKWMLHVFGMFLKNVCKYFMRMLQK
jgi:hypothetical protein